MGRWLLLLGCVLLLLLLPSEPAVAKKPKKSKKAKKQPPALGLLHHRTYTQFSGTRGLDGGMLLSAMPSARVKQGDLAAETVALPMECSIERRETISAAEFETDFRHRRPLIVTAPMGSMDDHEEYGAKLEHFSYDAVKRKYGDKDITVAFPQHPIPPPAVEQSKRVDTNNPHILRLGLRRIALSEYMDRKYSEADPLYLFARLTQSLTDSVAVERAKLLPEFAAAVGINSSTFIGVGRSGSGLPFHWRFTGTTRA